MITCLEPLIFSDRLAVAWDLPKAGITRTAQRSSGVTSYQMNTITDNSDDQLVMRSERERENESFQGLGYRSTYVIM